MRVEGWQDIATAPRDGTPLMLFARCKGYAAPIRICGFYSHQSEEWIETAFAPNVPIGLVPTLWQPLPAPPQAQEAGDERG